MEVLKPNGFNISRTIGQDYSFREKLQIRGTGSAKMIYVKGIPSFNQLANSSQSHSFVNFQPFPKGMVIRLAKNANVEGLILKEEEMKDISILARKIKIKNRSFLRSVRYKIVHDATLSIKLENHQPILFYCLTTHYNSILPFFHKSWLKNKLSISIDPSASIIDSNGLMVDTIMGLAS